jgi:predicted ATP-grasp superfamily ATP-dependent carboligase
MATLIGVTRQLAGCHWAGVDGFRYVGSIGPVPLPAAVRREFQRIGSCLATAFPLRGLFGVDTIVNADGVWTLEVNPRYTASVEILERALGWSGVELHCRACDGLPSDLSSRIARRPLLFGKAVIFAREDAVVGERLTQWLDSNAAACASHVFADLPAQGSRLSAGHPVLTVLTSGISERDVYGRLRACADQVQAAIARLAQTDTPRLVPGSRGPVTRRRTR